MNFPPVVDHYVVEVAVRTDAEAIAASVDDPDGFVVIFDRHIGAVYRFVARRYGADVAADLASETFARAFEARARYRPQTPTALPWLLGIATRLGANAQRREARRLRAYAAAASMVVRPREEPAPLDGEVMAALGRLRRGDRDALLLFAWCDLAYDEIAAALDVPAGTVRSRINRARRKLRETLAVDSEPPLVSGGRCDRA